ncbi:hypothetical protein Poli38472_004012 [Pythium oligandrum]|uniref:CS domain-containing protein n=1 Tax=Pythium oligandrum TaxID=41045 RepID=A0A8K1CMG6_PYTOL|nr:hypothetical protein Poli38472_004012 [Pythium oligandrum]|eukprot:TMW66247.1 hypothetical protein Poli38472_004012 [Pythium oligandrum]
MATPEATTRDVELSNNPVATTETETEETSALHSNIKTKGQNSYYYAHKKRDGVEVHDWDGKAAPRLLKTEQINKDEIEHAEAITNYAWADGKKKVSIYVTLPNIGAHPEDLTELNWTATTLELRVRKLDGKTRVLSLKLYDEISDIKIKRKENQLVLLLHKAKEFSWFTLKKEK